MKHILKALTAVCIVVFATIDARAQGCSDAGACTIHGFTPASEDGAPSSMNRISIGFLAGRADNAISVYGSFVEYHRVIRSDLSFDAKVTSIAQNGNGIASFGISDVYLNANIRAFDNLSLTVGAKVPLSTANTASDGIPLPMDYQSSLGTFDAIVGVSYSVGNLQLVAAMQQPLTQNTNQFLASSYPVDSPLREFQSTNGFQRSADVLLRASYPFTISEQLIITPSLLPIYHVANDRFKDELGVEREIVGSRGLTLNANVFAVYAIGEQDVIQFTVGVPVIVRDSRPDGLTRSVATGIEYRVGF